MSMRFYNEFDVKTVPQTLHGLQCRLRQSGESYLRRLAEAYSLRIIRVQKRRVNTTKEIKYDRIHICDRTLARSPISYYLNGVILCPVTWDVIAIHPRPFYQASINELDQKDVSQYDVYPMLDGTILTLYYWDNRWNLMSTRGYDVSTYEKSGCKITYAEMIYDIAKEKYPEFVQKCGMNLEDGRLTFTSLATNICYSFGFKHPRFHIFSDEKSIWQVQHTVLKAGGLYEVVDTGALPFIPNQTTLEIKFNLYSEAVSMLANELTNYIDAAKTGSTPSTINYGFILKSKTNTNKDGLISIRSPLYNKIKEIVYHRNDDKKKDYIGHIMARGFLSPNNRYIMRYLFPKYALYIDVYEKIIEELDTTVLTADKSNLPTILDPVYTEIMSKWYIGIDNLTDMQKSALREFYYRILEDKNILIRYITNE